MKQIEIKDIEEDYLIIDNEMYMLENLEHDIRELKYLTKRVMEMYFKLNS